MKKLLFSLALLGTIFIALFTTGRRAGAQEENNGDEKIEFRESDAGKLERAKQISLEILSRQLLNRNVGTINDLKIEKVEIDDLGMAHTRVRQTVGDVPVWEGEAIVHLKADGSLFAITDDLKESLTINPNPKLSAEEAVRIADSLYKGGAKQTAAPKVELWVYRGKNRDYLVYRVETERIDGSKAAAMPVDFIDAHTGKRVFGYNNLQSGTGVSLYSGTVAIGTSSVGSTFYMENPTRRIGTFDLNNGSTTVFRLVDADDFWNSPVQRAGVDAQFGAETTINYYQTVHGRNGIDGSGGPGFEPAAVNSSITLISSFVHYGSSDPNNAFWQGQYMLYGDGDGFNFSPLTTLDICGHELTHGVTQYTAGLIYASESGALNESMSDVFGTMVERHARPSTWNWKCGEDAYTPFVPGDAVRYLDNPHTNNYPDHYTLRLYQGACTPIGNPNDPGYNDNCGVHTNSSITNHVFYLIAAGGTNRVSGLTVTGIGPDNAAKIWYRALSFYMTSGANFAGARTATLNAATALFGASSAQYNSVAQGWCAIGVGSCPVSSCSPAPISVGQTINGTLQSGDCLLSSDNSLYDAYTFNGTIGQQIYITMNSTQFDTYLLLVQGNFPGGGVLIQDDNGGGGTNARIPPGSGYFLLPSTGTYTILANARTSGLTGNYTLFLGTNSVITSRKPYDYDGDGKADISVFRPSTGYWYISRSGSNGSLTAVQFGQNGDLPAPGDFDGDAKADVTVYRPSAGSWYRLNSSNGVFVGNQFGIFEDKPIVGDFDGDGKNDLNVFRPSNGTWYRLNSSNGQFVGAQFGSNGDKPVAADFDGDGKTDLAVYRPSSGYWYVIHSNGGAFIATQFGIAEDKPSPADFDGDGKADRVVFRPSNGTWYLLRSTAGFTGAQFGANGDVPTPNAFVR